ncbi:MAG: hypothetical protein IKS16_02070 [Lachnospiraceae bacterium]|nr:hypothetical protein [Lachnospiraceae bacterium]
MFKKLWQKTGIYGPIVLLQYIAVVIFNFMYTDNAVDSDTAKLLRHAVEMSRNHTLNIRDWLHTTTMEWDTSALLAAPFYTFTHNIYISAAIANTLITALFICLIFRLFDRFGLSIKTALKACMIFLIPYAFGMLDYFNLLMFGGAQYVFRVMIPILLIIIIMTPRAKRIGVENILLGILALILIIIASVSSGLYIVVSCVMPVLLVVILDALISGDFRKYDLYQYLVCAVALVASVAGAVTSIRIGEANFGNTMSLLRWYDLRYYIQCFAEGYFRLMGAMPGAVQDESVAVFSLRGFAFLFKLLISVLIMVTFMVGLVQSAKAKARVTSGPDIRFPLCGIALVNLIILLVCETRYSSLNSTLEYRYLIPVVIPVLLCVPVQLEQWQEAWSTYLRNAVWIVFTAGVLYTTTVCYMDAHDKLDPYAYCYEIVDYVQASGYETAIFMDDRPTAECCRIIDMDREYEAYSSAGNMDIVDYYLDAVYSHFYDDEHLLFVISGISLPDVLGDRAGLYTFRETVLWFDVYEASEFTLGMAD